MFSIKRVKAGKVVLTEKSIEGFVQHFVVALSLIFDEPRAVLDHLAKFIATLYSTHLLRAFGTYPFS